MANNPALYNAAFSGSSAGMGSRSLTVAAAPFFVQTANACTAFALAIDSALGVLSNITQADCDLLQAICASYWQNRVPTHQAEADYTDIAGPLADYFLAMRAGLDAAGVPMIGSDDVINQSNVPGATATNALDYLLGIDINDPPAIVGTLFGTNLAYAFSASQITASNNEQPKYQWVLPIGVDQFSIGPDGAMYNGSLSGGGLVRTPLKGSGNLTRYLIAPTPAGAAVGSNVWFGNQSPAAGLSAWSGFLKRVTPAAAAMRFSATVMQGNATPAWVSPEAIITTIAIAESCMEPAGNTWIQDSSSAIVRVTNLTGPSGAGTSDVGPLQGSNWPNSRQGMAVSSAGNLYTSRYAVGAGDIRMLNAATIAGLVGAGPSNVAPTAIITSTELQGAGWIFFDYAGNLWGASYDNTRLICLAAADLLTTGAKTPIIVLTGGGYLGNGNTTGPSVIRPWIGTGPLR